MRSIPTVRLANLATGLTPARLFQISTIRLLSVPMSSANCSSLTNTANPVSLAASGRRGRLCIFGVNRKCLHVSALFPTAYGVDDIHRSGLGHKQGNSEGKIVRGERLAIMAVA